MLDVKILRAKVKELVAKDEIENAIILLTEQFTGNVQLDQILLHSARYHSLKKDQHNGVIDYETIQLSLNQLRITILEFINNNEVDNYKVTAPSVEELSVELKINYQLSLARIIVLKTLEKLDEEQTVSTIYQLSGIKNRKYVMTVLQELEAIQYIVKTKVNKNTLWKLSKKGILFSKTMKFSILIK